MQKVLIEIRGGMIWNITTNAPIEFIIADYDAQEPQLIEKKSKLVTDSQFEKYKADRAAQCEAAKQ